VRPDGEIAGRLERDVALNQRPDREASPHDSWAILIDGSVLQVRTFVYGEPDDRIEVVRWAPR
jgi:hypothetical protein